ncbi:MAG: glycoside hydrolase family 127 protein [Candidatus Vecturithrix sp.]|jgi:hypothetical protein|nr:glycoside hydrolase family 127 protein [Candidatus Vecturithrix sp.]
MRKPCLQQPYFRPFPLGSITPLGWLKNQLRIQADGLSGHLDEFWPDIKDSAWFGGNAEGWERAPYWLDGFIPLAYTLDDPTLKARAQHYIEYIMEHQHDDGWLGPGYEHHQRHDIWSLFLALKALIQYDEAAHDSRVLTTVEKSLRGIDRHIDTAPLFNWAQFRWFEALIPLYWLYERTGGEWVLELAVKLHAQGFNWSAFFEHWPMTEPTEMKRWNYMSHVVNNAMAIKAHGLWQRLSGKETDRTAVYDMIEQLDRCHGMATGVFTGDECLAGTSPIHGTELCAVVEYMYSLEILLSVFGDPAFGDRLEKIAFNALPATFSPDMWSHQYVQQINQIECSIREKRPWNTNDPDANIFGLEPHYGCCTANLSQGWPKFTAHLWMQTADQGLAAVAYAPNVVIASIQGARVEIITETEYPFRERLKLNVNTDSSVQFPLLLRIPQWAAGAAISLGSGEVILPQSGAFHRLEREWKQGITEVTITFPMPPQLTHRPRNTVAIERGPLVYGLKIGEKWKRVNADKPYRELPHADYEVYATTPWNYGLEATEDTFEQTLIFTEQPFSQNPFSPEGAPITCQARGRRIPEWQNEHGSAGILPEHPVTSSEPEETLTLIPYGCTNLRVTEFPVLKRT